MIKTESYHKLLLLLLLLRDMNVLYNLFDVTFDINFIYIYLWEIKYFFIYISVENINLFFILS